MGEPWKLFWCIVVGRIIYDVLVWCVKKGVRKAKEATHGDC